MKVIATALLIAVSANSFAQCKKIEYAQLKDSSKAELVNEYCLSMAYASIEEKSADETKEAIDAKHARGETADAYIREMAKYHANSSSCREVAVDAARVLMRKFRVKPPECRR